MSGGRGMRQTADIEPARLAMVSAALAFILLIGLAPGCQAEPVVGDYFTYEYTQKVSDGHGGYYGWWEKTESSGRYDVVSVSGSKVEMTASYGWTYDASDAPKTPLRQVDLNFSYSTANRTYISGYDLDVDYGPNPSIWFCIPTNVTVGQSVRILDSVFIVESLDATVWSNSVPMKGILLENSGFGSRDDAYGDMCFSYTDRYYMDRETGYIIAERYTEHDSGTWSGYRSSFTWTEEYDVISSSYSLDIDWFTFIFTILEIAGVAALIGGAIYALRWFPRSMISPDKIKVYRIRKIGKYPHLPNRATLYFEPFLEDFAHKALLSNGRVAVAVSEKGLEGLAIYHRDAKVGAIFCKDYRVNEVLRKYIGAKDFFSEVRHQVSDSEINELSEMSISVGHEAYNIFETSSLQNCPILDLMRRISV